MSGKRSLLESPSWEAAKEAVKKQEAEKREQDERIKEARRLLEETAAVIPDQLGGVSKNHFEEFFNADVNEFDTNEDGFAGEDGLMSDPLETMRQLESVSWVGTKESVKKQEAEKRLLKMELKLEMQSDYETVKKELNILKSLEFSQHEGADGEEQSNQVMRLAFTK